MWESLVYPHPPSSPRILKLMLITLAPLTLATFTIGFHSPLSFTRQLVRLYSTSRTVGATPRPKRYCSVSTFPEAGYPATTLATAVP